MDTLVRSKADRVRKATPASINEEIEKEMWNRIAKYQGASVSEISERIKELEKEWDIERYLGVNMSAFAISGLALSAMTKNRYWLILPTVVLGFFMQHSIQGWCPPLPILRKLKIRTQQEIDHEKYALKLLRGYFNEVNQGLKPILSALKDAVTVQ